MRKVIWDYQDDYYYVNLGNIEINIRAYTVHELSMWIYHHNINKELVDEDYSSIKKIEEKIKEVFGFGINLPSVEQLLNIKGDTK